MKILIIGAHPDDEILGCGGIINRFRDEGYLVEVFICGNGRIDKMDEEYDGISLKYWVEKIEEKINDFKPNIVFTHFLHDVNQDHQVIAQATMVACRPESEVKTVYSYEIPHSTEFAEQPFKPDTYVELKQVDMDYKTDQMKQQYAEEVAEFPHPRSIDGIYYKSRVRGSEILVQYAEAFMTIRRIL